MSKIEIWDPDEVAERLKGIGYDHSISGVCDNIQATIDALAAALRAAHQVIDSHTIDIALAKQELKDYHDATTPLTAWLIP